MCESSYKSTCTDSKPLEASLLDSTQIINTSVAIIIPMFIAVVIFIVTVLVLVVVLVIGIIGVLAFSLARLLACCRYVFIVIRTYYC